MFDCFKLTEEGMPEHKTVNPNKTLGERVRALRKGLGHTIEDLAGHTGVSDVQMSHLERGLRRWHVEQIAAVSEYFGLSAGLLQDPSIDIEKLVVIVSIRNWTS